MKIASAMIRLVLCSSFMDQIDRMQLYFPFQTNLFSMESRVIPVQAHLNRKPIYDEENKKIPLKKQKRKPYNVRSNSNEKMLFINSSSIWIIMYLL